MRLWRGSSIRCGLRGFFVLAIRLFFSQIYHARLTIFIPQFEIPSRTPRKTATAASVPGRSRKQYTPYADANAPQHRPARFAAGALRSGLSSHLQGVGFRPREARGCLPLAVREVLGGRRLQPHSRDGPGRRGATTALPLPRVCGRNPSNNTQYPVDWPLPAPRYGLPGRAIAARLLPARRLGRAATHRRAGH